MRAAIKSSNPHWIITLVFILSGTLISACDNTAPEHEHSHSANTAHGETEKTEIIKGSHGGRMLSSELFDLELSIFETGVPPEFRAWARYRNQPLSPSEVELKITLTRLGGAVDNISFKPHGDAMRGDRVIYEPHSFVVNIDAIHKGIKYHWQYDNFEGRTKIETAVAQALEINTDIAGPVVLQQTINVFGKITPNTEQLSHVSARFAGVIKSVAVSVGDAVKKNQLLATVESNESLKLYTIKATTDGVITQRRANAGEQTGTQTLFTITDTSTVWVDLSIFPADQQHVKVGADVSFTLANTNEFFQGKIAMINILAEANQSVIARMVVKNTRGQLLPGRFVKARVKIGEIAVALAVKRSGLQTFRDFTVVYAQTGEEYEVRMLELGRQDDEWIEVSGGLEAGTRYVSENSYVIKADIEKSGASHDH
ncbi:MAG TPA: HlyD family efflux transporter periplasmic adaptor subunit [Gammaproteobacteria bacterium]|nr:HlyD family efflux transporter periplasmic adaptor subunit [Gammaproteobacteria bacterium]